MADIPGRFYQNSSRRFSATYTDSDGTLFDPDTVTFRLMSPSGAVASSYVFGTDDEVENASTGEYDAIILIGEESGEWFWRWEATLDGTIVQYAAHEGSFVVRDSPFFTNWPPLWDYR